MPRIRTSRRVPPLKDSDYDHEISLADNAPSDTESQSSLDSEVAGGASGLASNNTPESQPEPEARPNAQLEPPSDGQPEASRQQEPELDLGLEAEPEASASRQVSAEAPSTVPIFNKIPPTPAVDPTGMKNGVNPSPSKRSRRNSRRVSNASRRSAQSAIDILYENERGGILCGIPLFSCKALGSIDTSPWTNAGHKPSLTSTATATVPDPSWEWAWPEWKVNHDIGVDKDGWEYSFMFSKRFSWHGPKWWNSFVRRRAWIRRRIRRRHHDSCDAHLSDDPCLLNPDYFTVRPASQSARSRSSSITSHASRMSSVRGSRVSMSHSHNGSVASVAGVEETPDIVDMDMLFAVLKCSRIDREKIEAVENYIEHGGEDLARLQESMHDIMRLFVFQSSRQILLTRLMQIYDETCKAKEKEDSPELEQRAKHLSAAIKHGDEEVRKLEYWSDIKGMAERGESGGAVDGEKGWDEERFKGLDNSAPAAPPLKPQPEVKDGGRGRGEEGEGSVKGVTLSSS